jgi:hypothetical protein
MRIKEWFLVKNYSQNERYAISVAHATIEKESEKAIFVKFESEFGNIKSWIPKSCIMTDEEIKAEIEVKKEIINKYESLIQWSKDNGVKGVRKMMKKSTLLKKIKDAGLEVPAELL